MECLGPIVVLLVLAAQVVTAIRKNQEQTRRRAMQEAGPVRPPTPLFEIETPPPRRPVFEPEEEGPPKWSPPPKAQEAPRRVAAPTTVPIGDLVHRRRTIRVDHARLRSAIVLSEILAPPVALR